MIKANFSAYSKYVTDSLNQWDQNQVLQVTGLNLTAAPEVHFSNANTDRAIVRQAAMENHVVRVNIPNSLLQDPLRIYAHIGIYDGETFKVVEQVEIPVIARKRPEDYQIDAGDDEVYSFKRLENLIGNAATKDQVANIVANVGSTAELVDVRYGADGKTYASAGEAVRSLYAPSIPRVVDATNYETVLPDANISKVSIYKLLFETGSNDIPKNLPFTEWEGGIATLLTTNTQTGGMTHYVTQTLITPKNIYYRYSGTGFVEWVNLSEKMLERAKNTAYKVTSGGSILEALKTCYEKGYTRLIVEAGKYDIIEEYKAHYGSTYFDNYKGYAGLADVFHRGLWLENIEVVFNPGAFVECKYTGSNEYVKNNFCAFATGNNVTIDGLHLDAEYLRYGIHADFNSGTELTTMKIRNCDLRHFKNTVNSQAIGAGLGVHVLWEIENTIFRSEYKALLLRIHNNINAAAKSKVVIRNCYVTGPGFFRFNSYSDSTELSDIIVTGCSYATEPVVGMEIEGATTPENIRLIAWNNTLRT